MAHMLYTPTQAARSSLAALRFKSSLARIVNQDYSSEFVAGRGSTVDVKRPVVLDPARVYTKANRSAGDAITYSDLLEPYVSVKLTDQVYQAIKLPDDFATFDLENLERQVIAPMATSVADEVNAAIVRALSAVPAGLTASDSAEKGKVVGESAQYDSIGELITAEDTFVGMGVGATVQAATITDASNQAEARRAISAAHQLLSQRGAPTSDRYLVVGANWEASILEMSDLNKVNEAGSDGQLRDAVIGRLRGFTVIVDYNVDPGSAFAIHADGVNLSTRVAATPRGVAFAGTASADGFTLRYLHDYDADHLQDRAVMDLFVGAEILDAQRIVHLTGTDTIADPAPVNGGAEGNG